MISTVTTSTFSTVTTAALMGWLTMLSIAALLIFLIQKEILAVSEEPRAQVLGKVLNIAIIPLLMGFLFTALLKIVQFFD